ncbi:MAG: 30S ribosomal protein S27ae [Nitrososphaeria archaeon]|nr:30S ribosomal protein S27ae [Nitrososphaeria archaeon]
MSEKGSKKALKGVWKLYVIQDDKIVSRRVDCPKCGRGVFLAEHEDRLTCGRCGFTKFKR